MSTTTRLITADELLTTPHRDGRNDCRLALIRGELIKMSPTGGTHGILCARLAAVLLTYAESNDLGIVFGAETGFQVEHDPDTVIGADVAFVSKERFKDITDINKFVPFAPDLSAEVLSPGNRRGEIEQKIRYYFAAGTRLMWVVNPKSRTVTVYRSADESRILGEGDSLDGEGVLPGFRYEISRLFGAAQA
jgi:Uma2 family endonuclease